LKKKPQVCFRSILLIMTVRKLSVLEISVLCLAALIIAVGFLLAFSNVPLFEKYVEEDGLIEWLTVLSLLAASGVCLYRAATLFNRKPAYFIFTSAMLGLLLFVAAGEEISWGQRIFGIETPEYFKENNLQSETNLHNLEINGVKINLVVFSYLLIAALVVYLGVFPFLYNRSVKMKNFINRWGVPLAQGYQIIGFLSVFAVTALIPHGKRAELLECGAALLFFLIIYRPANIKTFQKGVPLR